VHGVFSHWHNSAADRSSFSAAWLWCMGCCLSRRWIGTSRGLTSLLPWCMGSWLARTGRRRLACGGVRRAARQERFYADAGRCTPNTRMGQGPPRRRCDPGFYRAGFAVNLHASLRPIRVFRVHLPASA
jgi:hypothetical protein